MALQTAPGELLDMTTETSVVYPQKYIVDQNGIPVNPIEGASSRITNSNAGNTFTNNSPVASYVFTMETPAILWDIIHDLDTYPAVTVTNISGQKVEPDIYYINANEIKISFAFPFAGYAYLN